MSKYTTEVRFLCETLFGLKESVGATSIDTILDSVHSKIFDFEYPIFDTNYKKRLETKILKHYYTREISEETVGLWKLRLNAKLNEIMPYYNQLYESELIKIEPIVNYDHTKQGNNRGDSTRSQTDIFSGSINDTSDGNTTRNRENLFQDTPQNGLSDVRELKYLTNATIDNDNDTTHATDVTVTNNSNTMNGSENHKDDYFEHISGYSGTSGSKLLEEYRKTFLNIDLMVINELEPLFFGLW